MGDRVKRGTHLLFESKDLDRWKKQAKALGITLQEYFEIHLGKESVFAKIDRKLDAILDQLKAGNAG